MTSFQAVKQNVDVSFFTINVSNVHYSCTVAMFYVDFTRTAVWSFQWGRH